MPGLAAAVGARVARQARPDRVAAFDHARGADRGRELQQRVRPPEPRGLLPHEPARSGRRVARLSQADHDRGRPRQRARRERRKGGSGPGREARRARRPRDADRPRRRRGVVAGQRCRRGGARLRIGAARQRRDAAARARGHRRLLRRSGADNPIAAIHDIGAGGLSNAVPEIVDHSRCGARDRLARDPERRARHEPDGALVQRIARALHADDRGARRRSFRRDLRARALPVRRARRAHGEARSRRARCSARRRARCDADGRAVRQAAEDDAARVARAVQGARVAARAR